MAIRMLPLQHSVLVVRRIEYRPHQWDAGHPIEMYKILFCKSKPVEQRHEAFDRIYVCGFKPLSVQITDHGIPFNVDQSIFPRIRKNWLADLDEAMDIPFPITVLSRTDSFDDHYHRVTIFPAPIFDEQLTKLKGTRSTIPVYHLNNHTTTRWSQPDQNVEYRAIPGALRTFVYAVEWNDRECEQVILGLWSWRDLWHNSLPDEYQAFVEGRHPRSKHCETLIGRGLNPVKLGSDKNIILHSHAYDETTGRLCLSSGAYVRVLDFAKAPRRGTLAFLTTFVSYFLTFYADDWGERRPLAVSQFDGQQEEDTEFFKAHHLAPTPVQVLDMAGPEFDWGTPMPSVMQDSYLPSPPRFPSPFNEPDPWKPTIPL